MLKQFIKQFGNYVACASAGVLVLGIAALNLMEMVRPDWFCQAINPGGKEFVCGSGYSLPEVEAFSRVILVATLALYFLGLVALFSKNIRRGGVISLGFVTIVLLAGLAIKYYLGQSDMP